MAWFEGWRSFGFGGAEAFDDAGQSRRLTAGAGGLARRGVEQVLLWEALHRVETDAPATGADVRRVWMGDLIASMDGQVATDETVPETQPTFTNVVVLRKPTHKLGYEQAKL